MNAYSVLLFGIVRERAGASHCTIELPDHATVAHLRQALEAQVSGLAALRTYAISVNATYAMDDEELPRGAEIAIIPPVSGG